jgi:hypothetical protein
LEEIGLADEEKKNDHSMLMVDNLVDPYVVFPLMDDLTIPLCARVCGERERENNLLQFDMIPNNTLETS